MTQVVIDDIIPRTQLIAAAAQTVFNTNWTADATTDIDVYARAVGIPPDDITQIVDPSLYNVTFIGGSQTVRVTFISGRALNDVITIVRNTPAERLNLYINTNFTPSMLNQDFGILTLVDQQAQMFDTVINPGYNISATIEPDSIVGGGDKILPILPPGYGWRKNNANTAIEAFSIPDGGFAPSVAKYILQEANTFLPNAFSLGTLTDGLLKQTVSGAIATPAIAQLDTDYYGPGMTGFLQAPAGVKDSNGQTIVEFKSEDTSRDQYIVIYSGKAGDPAAIAVEGAGTDIQLNFYSLGLGAIAFNSEASSNAYSFFSGTNYQHHTTFSFANTNAFRQVTWQDANGTVAYLSDVAGSVTSAEGTVDEILVNGTTGSPQTGDIILTLPQAIAPTSSPTFNSLTLTTPLAASSGGTGLSALGTGVATALGINVGSAGAFVTFNGAGGTPSSMTGTNITGTASGFSVGFATTAGSAGSASSVPLSGITGFGTGVETALAINIGSAGAPILFNGAAGTPSSMVGTNITGTAAGLTAGTASAVAVGGITGLGTGVATALAANLNGSGALAATTSPTFVTPILGVATATSMNFGGGALKTYKPEGTFTPTVTFATPGDLSVAYSTQIGLYTEVGNMVFVQIFLGFVPTFTTASGQVRIAGLPISSTNGNFTLPIGLAQSFAFPVGTTMLAASSTAGQSYLTIVASGTAVAAANVGTTQLVSGAGVFLTITGFYTNTSL